MSLAPAEFWGMEWPDVGCGMQWPAFHVQVDRLSVLLELKLRPPVKPSCCLDRDLFSCEVVDRKTDKVAVLGFVPVFLGPVGLVGTMRSGS